MSKKSFKQFKVWVDCTVLGYFENLKDAIAAAPLLIADYNEEWDPNEYPRIYEEKIFDALGVRYHNAVAMYDLTGKILYKF